jgi:enhancing lycopene biosynthesis protein 2
VTLGEDDGLITGLGGKHQDCPTRGIVIDDANCLVSTPAYMQKAPLAEVATGITELVRAVLTKIKTGKDAA